MRPIGRCARVAAADAEPPRWRQVLLWRQGNRAPRCRVTPRRPGGTAAGACDSLASSGHDDVVAPPRSYRHSGPSLCHPPAMCGRSHRLAGAGHRRARHPAVAPASRAPGPRAESEEWTHLRANTQLTTGSQRPSVRHLIGSPGCSDPRGRRTLPRRLRPASIPDLRTHAFQGARWC